MLQECEPILDAPVLLSISNVGWYVGYAAIGRHNDSISEGSPARLGAQLLDPPFRQRIAPARQESRPLPDG